MSYPIFRVVLNRTSIPDFKSTSASNDTSFARNNTAKFVLFDRELGLEILGSNPTNQYGINMNSAIPEAPVYVSSPNQLYFPQLEPVFPPTPPQVVLDLSQNAPTLSENLSDPPVYAPNGGTFYRGMVY